MYQRWIYQKQVEETVACGRAPEVSEVRFEDEVVAANTAASTASIPASKNIDVKCRMCRRTIATSPFIIPHAPKVKQPPDPSSQTQHPSSPSSSPASTTSQNQPCAHIFLHPLSWMRPALAPGTLDGRLTCPNPRCATNIGKFAWQGQRCSCGEWVVPGFSVLRGKVDESKPSSSTSALPPEDPRKQQWGITKDGGGVGSGSVSGAGGAGIRLPPNFRHPDAPPVDSASRQNTGNGKGHL